MDSVVLQSKAGRISVSCQGCLLSCQSNRLTNVHRQIPKLTLCSPIRFSGRRLRQGPSDQWGAVIIESLKEGEGGGGGGRRWLPRIRTCTPTRSTPRTTPCTARAQTVPCACAAIRLSTPPPCLRSSVCVCKLVQGWVSQPLRAQTSGWVCAL